MVHHLGFGGRVPPDLPPQNCAPERELAATRRGSRTSPAKPSRILFLIANRIMSIYTRFRSDQVLNIGNYLCPTSGGPSCSLPTMGSEAEVADCRARWRLRSGLKQQLLKSGLAYVSNVSNEIFGNDQKKYIYGVKLIRSPKISSLLA